MYAKPLGFWLRYLWGDRDSAHHSSCVQTLLCSLGLAAHWGHAQYQNGSKTDFLSGRLWVSSLNAVCRCPAANSSFRVSAGGSEELTCTFVI